MSVNMDSMVVKLAEQARNQYYGKYRGIVAENEDPENMGRVKARVPDVFQDVVTSWALPCSPYAGVGSGQYSIPAVDAGVWIEFEAGDPAKPIWTGCWWGRDEVPVNEEGTGKSPTLKVIRSETGLLVSMDDDGQTLSISDKDGENILKIEVRSGDVLLKGVSKVTVEAPQICLVENARHPVVFGDNMLKYLTQLVTTLQIHTHPGQLAAGVLPVSPMVPVPTFPLPQTSLLSTKVKSG